MTHTVLVLVVFLLNGEPQSYAATLAPGVVCDAAQAASFARHIEAELAEPIQEQVLWRCLPVRSPGPATDSHQREVRKGDTGHGQDYRDHDPPTISGRGVRLPDVRRAMARRCHLDKPRRDPRASGRVRGNPS